MKVAAVLFAVLGVLALIALPGMDEDREIAMAQAVAVNFISYRTAANKAAVTKPPVSGGRIKWSDLSLEEGWQAMRSWDNRMDGERFYVFGPSSPREFLEIRQKLKGSLAITRQDGSHPSFIPVGAVVSVIEVTP